MSEMCWSTDWISVPSLPFLFESGDVEIAYWFATLVEYAESAAA
jgi:hypothetical protein